MKPTSLAARLAAFASISRLAMAYTDYPTLQYDPETISSCIIWENNARNLVCEDVRESWNITAEEFSSWNPSVGLDCKPWIPASYCVMPEDRLPDEFISITAAPTTSTTNTVTTSTGTLGPSPTSWEDRGCYEDNDEEVPTLQERQSQAGGDAALTITKCKNTCYEGYFEFAGVKAGNECHCGNYVAGERTLNQTECNVPCSGGGVGKCGGIDRLNIFMALENGVDENEVAEIEESEAGFEDEEASLEEQEAELENRAAGPAATATSAMSIAAFVYLMVS